MNVFDRMKAVQDTFTKTDQQIYQYVLSDADFIARHEPGEIAKEKGFSPASITRFVQKIGYKNYAEFKYDMQRSNVSTEPAGKADLYQELYTLLEKQYPAEKLKEITNLMYQSKRIFLLGYHKSRIPAEMFEMDLAPFRYDAQFLPMDKAFKLNAFAHPDDLIILFSVSSAVWKDVLADLRDMGESCPKILLLTMSPNHPLKKKADYVYVLPCAKSIGTTHYINNYNIYLYFIDMLCKKLEAKD